ncbi:MAG: PEP/pyruvate-binding domain-containing protein, partial [Planctomycetota bacterium]|nr:PEP/pyruvate-binding domain-containing protein [Planctomycetota bacterium]
ILPLDAHPVPLSLVGGKGRSLAQLVSAGLPVPDGFIVTTAAYRQLVEGNGLIEKLQKLLSDANLNDPAVVGRAAEQILPWFEHATLPVGFHASLSSSYQKFGAGDPPVAVRSSATAEDLPELSFAGQQDSFLEVRGSAALMTALRRCWASLWTARAILYRQRMQIDHADVAMGVVVQRMVPAEVSGILFTANPANGARDELVINASYGLGEAIVSGEVTPDTYLLTRGQSEPREVQVGGKEVMSVPVEGASTASQGTFSQPVPEAQRSVPSLSTQRIAELVRLSLEVETLCGGQPQDIEWGFTGDRCWLLQARPITELPPPPLTDVSWDPPRQRDLLVRRQLVEHLPDPLSPLFADAYLSAGIDEGFSEFLAKFMDLSYNLYTQVLDGPLFLTVNGYGYQQARMAPLRQLLPAVPRLAWIYPKTVWKFFRHHVSLWRDQGLPAYQQTIRSWREVTPGQASDEQILNGIQRLSAADAQYWGYCSLIVGFAKVTEGLLHWFLGTRLVKGELTSGMFLRGFPSKTIEVQQSLEAIATEIRRQGPLAERVKQAPASDLPHLLANCPEGHLASSQLATHLSQYGHQIYNLDFCEPTQIDQPLPVLLGLQRLLTDVEDVAARQAALIRQRDELVTQTHTALGPLRSWIFGKLLGWAQRAGPYREEALFYLGAGWPTLRGLALELGHRLVAAGSLATPDDVFYLTRAELANASAARATGQACPQYLEQAAQQRQLQASRRRLHPPGVLPIGARLKYGPFNLEMWETQIRNADDTDTLTGFPVSPGRVTGIASVIHSPNDFDQMVPGTVLVCPTTTPAWTPLFPQATALVTDIGGILAHGSIVAREYGIPAVLGLGNGTQRIASGQRITVDGTRGTVTLLEHSEAAQPSDLAAS